MKILVITTEYPGATRYTGGIGTQFRSLADEFDRLGHDVAIAVATESVLDTAGSLPYPVRRVSVRRVPGRPGVVLRPILIAWAFRRVLKRTEEVPDVILAPEWGGWASLLPRGNPVLVTHLATSTAQIRAIEPQGWKPVRIAADTIQGYLERRQIGRSSAIAGISKSLTSWTNSTVGLPDVPTAIIPNALGSEVVAAARPDTTVADLPRIIFVGRVCKWKGADVLAAAVRELSADGRRRSVDFYGRVDTIDGSEGTVALRKIAGPEVTLEFHGAVAHSAVIERISEGGIAVFPSRYEGFGIAALEAMAVGVPSIVTAGSGFAEFAVTEQNCLVVEPGDVGQLAHAIRRLEEGSDLRERLASRAIELREKFTGPQVALSYLDLFNAARSGRVKR